MTQHEPIYGVAPGQAYDATLDLLMPDDEDDDSTAKRPAVQKAGEEACHE